MIKEKFYKLPNLPYGYKDLEPYISEELLRLHHDKHHKAYIDSANLILEELDKARKIGKELEIKAVLKSLSYNIGGHVLHSLFWDNLTPDSAGKPSGELAEAIDNEFGSFERFKQEFNKAALSVEGSGWVALTLCRKTKRPIIMQIEKHNVNIFPTFNIILVLDMWEHAYYLDYKNEKTRFIDTFWDIVNWDEVLKRI